MLVPGLRSRGWKMRIVGRKDGEFLCYNGGREGGRDIWNGSELCRSMMWGNGEKNHVFRNCINLPLKGRDAL
jgi:hypothetical protein